MVRTRILEEIAIEDPDGAADLEATFTPLYNDTITALESLRDGALTIADFSSDGVVASFKALLGIAETRGLTADFAGIPVTAAQVQRGLDLFDAFAFDVASGTVVDELLVNSRSPFAGEAVLLKAMNDPASLLLLGDPSEAAREAVSQALRAEVQAAAADGAFTTTDGANLTTLAGRVAAVIDGVVPGDERLADLITDLQANIDSSLSAEVIEARVEALIDYRSLLEDLKVIASAEVPDYSQIDFSGVVSPTISALEGLSVDGAVVSAANIATATSFLTELEGLRTSSPASFEVLAKVAVALNVGTITDALSFGQLLEDWRDALRDLGTEGLGTTFLGLPIDASSLTIYLNAYQSLAPESQALVAAPFLETSTERPSFVDFADPKALLKVSFLNGLINEAGLVRTRILTSIDETAATESEASDLKIVFNVHYARVIEALEKLRDGELTADDFGPTGIVSSLKVLLNEAESRDLDADFAGIPVTAAQVQKGLDLFAAFGNSGDAVLLAAMNDPSSLLLLGDPSAAAREAVLDAIAAEVKAGGTAETVLAPLVEIDPEFTAIITGEGALTGTDANEIFVGGGTIYSEGGTDLVFGGAGPDLFVIDLLDDGVDILAEFTRTEFNEDALGFRNAPSVGTGVLHQDPDGGADLIAGTASDIGLYVVADLSAQTGATTAEQVADYLDAQSLFDDAGGDSAFVIAPNVETVENIDDAVLLLATSDGETGTQVTLVAQFAILDFAELAGGIGDDIIQESGF